MTEINDVILGRRIRAIRNDLKLDQKQLAEKLDVTVSALSNWECGRNKPKEMFLEKIAVLGNTTVDEMMDREVVDYKQLYEQQKQRADELEDVIKRYHDEALREIKRADELEKRWSELKKSIVHMPCNQIGQISPRYIFDKIKQLEEDNNA